MIDTAAVTNGAKKNSYDEVPYASYPYAQSHPNRLATVATLFGMNPAPLDRCRVLELGCASGGNIIPMAAQMPGSTFVGVDGSARQVTAGQETIAATGLKNIRLEHRDILEIGPELGEFDYIIAHGVYSWVPQAVQDKILEICSTNLAPQGVAYVSYNTYPGWHMRDMIRNMMCYRAQSFDKPADRLKHARGLIDFLSRSVPPGDNPYGMLLKQELEQLSGKEDSYLLHDYLEENNSPVYFYEFMDRAAAKGLQYLGEADFRVMSVSNFPAEVQSVLHNVASTLTQMEQYMDFVRNRMFRQTLLCHTEVAVDRDVSANRISHLHVASASRPEIEDKFDIRSREVVTFRTGTSVLNTSEPLLKAAMIVLREAWPRSIPFAKLVATAHSRLNEEAVISDSGAVSNDARKLAEPLIRCYSTTHVELSTHSCLFSTKVAERPVAFGLARQQSLNSATVTNLRHERTQLNDMQRHVIQLLDGNHDQRMLLARLVELVDQNTLVIHNQGSIVKASEQVREILQKHLHKTIEQLALQALLMPPINEPVPMSSRSIGPARPVQDLTVETL